MAMVRIMHMRVLVGERSWRGAWPWRSVRCSHTPMAMRKAATQNGGGVASPSNTMLRAAPMKGAVEK